MDAAGVWYTIQGTGRSLTATTCSTVLNFDTKISLFEGTSCGDLACIDTANANDRWRCQNSTLDGSSSTINWMSEAQKTYYIFVHGGTPKSIGDFELSVTELPQATENNFCPQAKSVTSSAQLSGSTSEAAIGIFSFWYCGATIDNVGVWYSMEGTGKSIEVTGCSSGDDYHVSVSIFQGPCSNLTCVTGETFPISCSDFVAADAANRQLQPAGEQRHLIWVAEAGVSYKIFVHGQSPSFSFDGGTGAFELIIAAAPETEMPISAPLDSSGNATLEAIPSNPTKPSANPPTSGPTPQPQAPVATEAPSTFADTSTADTPGSEAFFLRKKSAIITVLASIIGLFL